MTEGHDLQVSYKYALRKYVVYIVKYGELQPAYLTDPLFEIGSVLSTVLQYVHRWYSKLDGKSRSSQLCGWYCHSISILKGCKDTENEILREMEYSK